MRIGIVVPGLAIIGAVAVGVFSSGSAAKPPAPVLGNPCGAFPLFTGGLGLASAPDQTAWNQDISQSPVAANSDAVIGGLPGELHPDFGSPRQYGIPYTVVGAKAKKVKVKFIAYPGESDKGPYRIPLTAPIEGGKNADGDRHVIAYDKSRCLLYELFNARPNKKRNRWEADGGAIWDLKSAGLRTAGWTSADAAGLPIFPGLVRYDEVAAGAVNHAIRLTFASSRDAYINPASHCAGNTNSATVPPMGMRFRLKASYDIAAITGQARVIAEALKRYGLIMADNGSDWYFSGSTDPRWNDNDLNQLKEIPPSAFEVVASQAEAVTC